MHGEVSTWQMPSSSAAITAGTVFLFRVTYFILFQIENYFAAFWALENVPVPQKPP